MTDYLPRDNVQRMEKQGQMRLGFGRYKGRMICDVPSDYLRWLLSLPDLLAHVALACRAELRQREKETWDQRWERETLTDLLDEAPHEFARDTRRRV